MGKHNNPETKHTRMTRDSGELYELISRFDGIPSSEIDDWKKEQRKHAKKFLQTPRAEKLYKEIITMLQNFSSTPWARDRLHLFFPSPDITTIEGSREMVMSAVDQVTGIESSVLKTIKDLLKAVDIPEDPLPGYDGSFCIVAENDDIYNQLFDLGLNRWCPVYTPSVLDKDSELILYVYEIGNLDIEGENVLMIPGDSHPWTIVPDIVLSFYKKNRSILQAVYEIQKLRKVETILEQVMDLLEQPDDQQQEHLDVRQIAEESLAIAKKSFTAAVDDLSLGGTAILELLGTGMPEEIRKPIREAEAKAAEHFRNITGMQIVIDTTTFPFSIDKEELENSVKEQRSDRKKRKFEDSAKRAGKLRELKDEVIKEIQSLLEFDLMSAIGAFSREYALVFPEMIENGDTFILEAAAHMKLLRKKECVRVDYHFGEVDNVVLLTGANSGGKTTLLETIAQAVIMGNMGFPVCAERAVLPVVHELHFHSQKKTMNAGAFEGFLKTFIPVVKKGKKKLILADELEAITELDAGARIMASILGRLKDGDSFAVVVSHMSEEIGSRLDVRIDGIEARGLDENLDLIVDRTPRIGYRARSTPELIVRRLYSLSKGEEKEIYGAILENFTGIPDANNPEIASQGSEIPDHETKDGKEDRKQ